MALFFCSMKTHYFVWLLNTRMNSLFYKFFIKNIQLRVKFIPLRQLSKDIRYHSGIMQNTQFIFCLFNHKLHRYAQKVNSHRPRIKQKRDAPYTSRLCLLISFLLVQPIAEYQPSTINHPLFLITCEYALDDVLAHLWSEEAYKPYHRETSNHGDGTAVDWVDRIAKNHVQHRKTHAPYKASPDGSCSHSLPVEP